MPEPRNILVIEDNAIDLHATCSILRKLYGPELSLQTASDFVTASDMLGQGFDVCLMDFHLGENTAFQLLQLFNPEELPGPVVIMTGATDDEVERDAARFGASDFLPKKELNAANLQRTIQFCVARHDDLRRMARIAAYDHLTGLLNRGTFLTRFERILKQRSCDLDECYLLYIDLDNFKSINDSYGHLIGDRVLTHAAQQLQNCIRVTDMAGRFGGDELIAAVFDVGRDRIDGLAEKMLAAMREPLYEGDVRIRCSVSFGIVRATQCPGDLNELLRMADQAMYAAKTAGRDGYRKFSSKISSLNRDRACIEHDLRTAIALEQLFLVFEPQVDIKSGKLIGAEALARWTHPVSGPIAPGTFIPIAERCGLVRSLGKWVLREALNALQFWQAQQGLPDDFRISINISVLQLLTGDFMDVVLAELEARALPGSCLRLELTEQTVLSDSSVVVAQLRRAVDAGISIAIDDFGTGYSSLLRLAELPVDTVKMDVSFVAKLEEDSRMRTLAEVIVYTGQAMQLNIVAEGVESKAQRDILAKMGCPYAQGWFYAPSGMHAESFQTYLQEQHGGDAQERLSGVAC